MIDDDDGIDLAELETRVIIRVELRGPDSEIGPAVYLRCYPGDDMLGVAMCWVGGFPAGQWSAMALIDDEACYHIYTLAYPGGVARATACAIIV